MIHYGDITKINGYDVPITDVIVGGSPCQNLSVAGKRTGLDGNQSKLFMEQIRITKEMRKKDAQYTGRPNHLLRPRFFVIVRRLTPLECERLQGYPDYYTDIGEYIDSKGKKKKTSDSARYKALGNSIALPPWKWVLKRISAQYERDATLASLFDGIGGFPYLWEQINGKGSCLWASEIEDFPIAVTTTRIR